MERVIAGTVQKYFEAEGVQLIRYDICRSSIFFKQ